MPRSKRQRARTLTSQPLAQLTQATPSAAPAAVISPPGSVATGNQSPTAMTTEATSYLGGLYQEFTQQVARYHELTAHLLAFEAKVELGEKTLCLVRDHLAMQVRRTDSAIPRDWAKTLRTVRFVGVRLAEACVTLLREQKTVTAEQMIAGLNLGMYRFRTNSPMREIHAALLRHPFVQRTNDGGWAWIGPDKDAPVQRRFRLVTKSETKVLTTDQNQQPSE